MHRSTISSGRSARAGTCRPRPQDRGSCAAQGHRCPGGSSACRATGPWSCSTRPRPLQSREANRHRPCGPEPSRHGAGVVVDRLAAVVDPHATDATTSATSAESQPLTPTCCDFCSLFFVSAATVWLRRPRGARPFRAGAGRATGVARTATAYTERAERRGTATRRWLARKDSNLQSPDPESGALPIRPLASGTCEAEVYRAPAPASSARPSAPAAAPRRRSPTRGAQRLSWRPCACNLAQVSLRVSVRLKTSAPAAASVSAQK